MEDQKKCAHCGELFEVNRRARSAHRFCRGAECQRRRRQLAQKARRARSGIPPPSQVGKRRRADYMREYRERHPQYRDRERELAEARRRGTSAGEDEERVVTEAGLTECAAEVYLVTGLQGGLGLRVVGEAGKTITLGPVGTWGASPGVVTEAG